MTITNIVDFNKGGGEEHSAQKFQTLETKFKF